ncbi:MAG TPA: HD domain-containing phosphohydrolase [Methylomirabilota bacterium]|nr:HD domain-containing phosphohydrolase [Methylomirabilota bacterium]
MSDVVRGIVRDKPAETAKDAPAPVAPPPSPPPPPPRPRPPVEEAPRPAPPPPPTEEARPSTDEPRAVEPGPSLDALPIEPGVPTESAEPLFAELQLFLARVRELIRTGDALPWAELEQIIERCAALVGSNELFWLANNTAAVAGVDYLAFHQARVAVLSMTIGASVGYDRSRQVQLGMAGSLIDVGLWQLPEGLLRRLDSLSPDEQTQYRTHPRLSVELIRRWSPPREALVDAVLQHHEREQGQGFPQGLPGAAVSQDAKVLGLIDTYTGLTMPPAPRPRLRPHEAIREIVRSKHEAFPSQLVKALLSEISVFPPGTLVRLNTGEVGRVTAVNRNHPLRPRVEIVADGKGQRLMTPKSTDLAEAPFLYITGAVAEGGR